MRFFLRWSRLLLLVLSGAVGLAAELDNVTGAQAAQPAADLSSVGKQRLIDWREIIANPQYRTLPERQKLELVNEFMNQTPFVSDAEHWGKKDYWATPVEFLSTNGGDCEDFAIAKYFTLRALGVSEERLAITYVKAIIRNNEPHMVLAYFPTVDAEPMILDNINKTILPASRRTDLVPVYSFNASVLWLAKEQSGRGRRVGVSDHIGHWRSLRWRMADDDVAAWAARKGS